jgi:hypothetical protein
VVEQWIIRLRARRRNISLVSQVKAGAGFF